MNTITALTAAPIRTPWSAPAPARPETTQTQTQTDTFVRQPEAPAAPAQQTPSVARRLGLAFLLAGSLTGSLAGAIPAHTATQTSMATTVDTSEYHIPDRLTRELRGQSVSVDDTIQLTRRIYDDLTPAERDAVFGTINRTSWQMITDETARDSFVTGRLLTEDYFAGMMRLVQDAVKDGTLPAQDGNRLVKHLGEVRALTPAHREVMIHAFDHIHQNATGSSLAAFQPEVPWTVAQVAHRAHDLEVPGILVPHDKDGANRLEMAMNTATYLYDHMTPELRQSVAASIQADHAGFVKGDATLPRLIASANLPQNVSDELQQQAAYIREQTPSAREVMASVLTHLQRSATPEAQARRAAAVTAEARALGVPQELADRIVRENGAEALDQVVETTREAYAMMVPADRARLVKWLQSEPTAAVPSARNHQTAHDRFTPYRYAVKDLVDAKKRPLEYGVKLIEYIEYAGRLTDSERDAAGIMYTHMHEAQPR